MAAELYKEEDSRVYNIGVLKHYERLAGSEAFVSFQDSSLP